jgi:AraC family transcriptional regulator
MPTTYEDRVNRVIDHVRQNLDADLSLNRLAKVANFSPYHFHRVFRASTGETVAEFTRRAQLERAAYLMKATPHRQLGSIALDVGFPSISEFSRAFKKQYGMAPSRWDRKTRLDRSGGPEPQGPPPAEPDPPFNPRIVEHEACRLAYVRMKAWFVGDELPRGYRRLVEWLEERDVDWRVEQLLGLSWDNYETTPLEQVRCDFGFTVPETVMAEGAIGIHEFPAVRSVEVHCQGGLQRIAEAWDYLYDVWFPTSGYEPDDMPAIKRFRRRPDELGWERWDLDCSIAVRPVSP